MRESVSEVIMGAAVVAVAAGFLVYTLQSTSFAQSGEDMVLTASFRSVEGVDLGTEVRLAGVQIGTVTALSLNEQSYRADTELTLDAALPIPDDSAAVVASEGLLGGTFIEIVPGGSLGTFETGGEITDTQGAVSLLQLLLTYVSGGDEP